MLPVSSLFPGSNRIQNRNIKLVNRSFENATQPKYFEAVVKNKKCIHEEFQSRLNQGVTCKGQVRIFYLPAFCLKIETENFVFNYIFIWVCNSISHPKVRVVEGSSCRKIGKSAGGWILHYKQFNIHVRITAENSTSEEAEGQKEIECAGNIKIDHQ